MSVKGNIQFTNYSKSVKPDKRKINHLIEEVGKKYSTNNSQEKYKTSVNHEVLHREMQIQTTRWHLRIDQMGKNVKRWVISVVG